MEIDEILPGCKIEVLESYETLEGTKETNIYKSSLFSVIDSNMIEIVAPQKKGTLIPLHMGSSYDLLFFDNDSMKKTEGVVVDRYRSGNFNLVRLHIVKKLSKFQRREFFRIDCMIPLFFTNLTKEELNSGTISKMYQMVFKRFSDNYDSDVELISGTIIDISGGGIRFTTDVNIDSNLKYLFIFKLQSEEYEDMENMQIIGRVVASEHLPGSDRYAHRIQFLFTNNKKNQDEIVKFIFEVERERRGKEQAV